MSQNLAEEIGRIRRQPAKKRISEFLGIFFILILLEEKKKSVNTLHLVVLETMNKTVNFLIN